MQVGFTGSREYPRPDLVENFVRALAGKYPDAVVVSGGRGAVDETAEATASECCGLEVISYRPTDDGLMVWRYFEGTWGKHPMLGYDTFVRNCFFRNEFIAACDRVVAFWNLESRGTADTISKARGKDRPVVVYGPDGAGLSEPQVTDRLAVVLG